MYNDISDIDIRRGSDNIAKLYRFINREAFGGMKPYPGRILFEDVERLSMERVTVYDLETREKTETLELVVPRRWARSAAGASAEIYAFLKAL